MARNFPLNSTTNFVTTPNSTVYDFTSNMVIMAIVNPFTFTSGAQHVIFSAGASGRGYNFGVKGTGGFLDLEKTGPGGISGTALTAPPTDVWSCVAGRTSNGGPTEFWRYNYQTGALTKETIGESGAFTSTSNDIARIGQYFQIFSTTVFAGFIDRVVLMQAAGNIDADVRHFAITGQVLRPVVGYWYLSGNPVAEPDWSGNGNLGTPTGSLLVDPAPIAPPFGRSLMSTGGGSGGPPPSTIPALDEGHLTGGTQPLGGGM